MLIAQRPGGVVEAAAAGGGTGVRDGSAHHLEHYVLDGDLWLRGVVDSAGWPRRPLLPLGFLVERLDGLPHGVADEARRIAAKVLLLRHGFTPLPYRVGSCRGRGRAVRV